MSQDDEQTGRECDLCKNAIVGTAFEACRYCGDVCTSCDTPGGDNEPSEHELEHLDQFDNLLARMQKLEIVAKRAQLYLGGQLGDALEHSLALKAALRNAGFKVE